MLRLLAFTFKLPRLALVHLDLDLRNSRVRFNGTDAKRFSAYPGRSRDEVTTQHRYHEINDVSAAAGAKPTLLPAIPTP
jgi:hypothetical protein